MAYSKRELVEALGTPFFEDNVDVHEVVDGVVTPTGHEWAERHEEPIAGRKQYMIWNCAARTGIRNECLAYGDAFADEWVMLTRCALHG
jgi:hypothetical protein